MWRVSYGTHSSINKKLPTVTFNFLKKFIFSSEEKVFVEDSYKTLLPLFTNINSYIQTFLGIFASSLMALNAALIAVILSGEEIRSVMFFSFGLCIFIAAIFLYLFTFYILLRLRLNLITSSKTQNIKFEKLSYKTESDISDYILYMMIVSFAFLVSFLSIIPSLIK